MVAIKPINERKMVEGYLYPCDGYECRGIILFPRKITMKDFEPAISNWLHYYKERKSRGEVTGYRFFRERLKDLEKAIKEGRLVCGHIRPCNKDPEEGLGPEVLELVGWLSEFAGKKVRITVEVLNDG